MPPFLPPLRTKPANLRRGGFPTDALKLSPSAVGRSFFASSELLNRPCGLWTKL